MKFHHLFKPVHVLPYSREYEADGVTMRLDFLNGILRIALIKDPDFKIPTFSVCPPGFSMPHE